MTKQEKKQYKKQMLELKFKHEEKLKEIALESKKLEIEEGQKNLLETMNLILEKSHKAKHQEVKEIVSYRGNEVTIKFRKQPKWKQNRIKNNGDNE